jgi:hypothetical protein
MIRRHTSAKHTRLAAGGRAIRTNGAAIFNEYVCIRWLLHCDAT